VLLSKVSCLRHDRALFRGENFVQHAREIHEWTLGATAG
jgi:hypothetical protein